MCPGTTPFCVMCAASGMHSNNCSCPFLSNVAVHVLSSIKTYVLEKSPERPLLYIVYMLLYTGQDVL